MWPLVVSYGAIRRTAVMSVLSVHRMEVLCVTTSVVQRRHRCVREVDSIYQTGMNHVTYRRVPLVDGRIGVAGAWDV
jgi:hypothetical protein